jgi:hypothetical protein
MRQGTENTKAWQWSVIRRLGHSSEFSDKPESLPQTFPSPGKYAGSLTMHQRFAQKQISAEIATAPPEYCSVSNDRLWRFGVSRPSLCRTPQFGILCNSRETRTFLKAGLSR